MGNDTMSRLADADDGAGEGYLPARPRIGVGGAAPAGPAAVNALRSTLVRLEEVLDDETKALFAFDLSRIDEFSQRKSRILLELTRLARSVSPEAAPAIIGMSSRLRDKLAENENRLRLHLAASREINEALTEAVRAAESDGTYEMPVR